MSIVLVLAGCNAAAKEKDEYFETTQKNIDANKEEIQSALDDFVGAVFDSEPEESIKILNEEMIPKYEKLLKTMNDVELKENELLIELNDLSKQLIESDMEKHLILRDLFEDIMAKKKLVRQKILTSRLFYKRFTYLVKNRLKQRMNLLRN